jgi:hypothetical protein
LELIKSEETIEAGLHPGDLMGDDGELVEE